MCTTCSKESVCSTCTKKSVQANLYKGFPRHFCFKIRLNQTRVTFGFEKNCETSCCNTKKNSQRFQVVVISCASNPTRNWHSSTLKLLYSWDSTNKILVTSHDNFISSVEFHVPIRPKLSFHSNTPADVKSQIIGRSKLYGFTFDVIAFLWRALRFGFGFCRGWHRDMLSEHK